MTTISEERRLEIDRLYWSGTAADFPTLVRAIANHDAWVARAAVHALPQAALRRPCPSPFLGALIEALYAPQFILRWTGRCEVNRWPTLADDQAIVLRCDAIEDSVLAEAAEPRPGQASLEFDVEISRVDEYADGPDVQAACEELQASMDQALRAALTPVRLTLLRTLNDGRAQVRWAAADALARKEWRDDKLIQARLARFHAQHGTVPPPVSCRIVRADGTVEEIDLED